MRTWFWRGLKGLGVLATLVLLWGVYVAVRERPHGTAEQQAASLAKNRDLELQVLPKDDRPVLVLLHGAGLNRRMWDPVVAKMDSRFRVLALDLPGHGARKDEVFTLQAAQDLLRHVASRVAPAPLILAGDSLGGYSALAGAASIPREQLRGLVLAGCSANYDPVDDFRVWRQLTASRWVMAIAGEDRMATYALNHFGVSADVQAAMKQAGLRLWAVEEAFIALKPVDFKSMLAQVEQPVLIVNGDGDVKALRQESAFLAVARQGSRRLFLQTGHGVSLLRPTELASVLNGFAQQNFPR